MNRKRLSIRGKRYLLTAFIFPLLIGCNSNNDSTSQVVKLSSISLSGTYQTVFTAGDTFNSDGLIVTAKYSDGTSKEVTNYTIEKPNMATAGSRAVRVIYEENGIRETAAYNITVNPAPAITLSSISISGSYQTTFTVNDTFTYSGLIVTAYYSNSTSRNVTNYTVSTPNMSTSGTKTVTVSYTESNITKYASYNITVNDVVVTLSSITLSGNYPTTFEVGDTFSYAGLIVTAHYSNSTSRTVTPTSVSSPNMSTSGNKTITVSYTDNGVTKTNSYSITVNEKEIVEKLDPRNEPYFSNQYYLNHIGDIQTVWNSYRGNGITVAVIDGGFKYNHEDFYLKDGTSKISNKSAYFYTSGSNTSTQVGPQYVTGGDAENHGTFCAGVVGASLNEKGVVGIAPECNLMLLKTDLKPKSINAAFKYASDNGAKVITISIGGYSGYNGDLVNDGSNLTTIFNDAVSYCRNKGTVVVSAAGNGGPSEANRPTDPTYPGATPGVIGVGGLAANSGDIWSGSSYNGATTFCDVFAPASGMFGMCTHTSSGYDGDWKGTSFASPIVAGIAALYFEKYPTNTVTQFENALYNGCLAMSEPSKTSHGAVDVAKTLGINTPSTNININVKSSWTNMSTFLWNDRTGDYNGEWPGVSMSKSGDIYTISVNPSQYPNIIFSTNSGQTQTVDILTTFLNDKIYNLTGGNVISIDGSSRWIGRYINN